MLYQEIRPKTLDDVVGNRSEIRSLRNLNKRDPKDRPHTILLSGPMGCGKTTIARILAREFGTLEHNIQELNTANVRGIDTVREILASLHCNPIGGGSITYILDEAHKITKDAMEALLKDTEDTPDHVYFIFCTTEPKKLLRTLRNRSTEYKVENLRNRDIFEILKRACKLKSLNIAEDILEVISENCDKTPRTALVLLEKIQDLTDLDEIAEVLASGIEIEENGDFINLCKMLLAPEKRRKNWKRILLEYEKLEQEPEAVRIGIMGFMRKQLPRIDPNDIEYARDVSRIMDILSSSIIYSGKHALVSMLMKICLNQVNN